MSDVEKTPATLLTELAGLDPQARRGTAAPRTVSDSCAEMPVGHIRSHVLGVLVQLVDNADDAQRLRDLEREDATLKASVGGDGAGEGSAVGRDRGGTVMRVGMTMPVMEPDLDAAVLRTWAKAIDDGPFSSLCWGERIAFDNPDSLTLLGALSAWTDRVPLVATVIVPQLHDPVMCAKALATGDVLSGGRLTVGIGVGGRHEDYRAVGADPKTQTMRGMAERVGIMRRVWAGEKVTESVLPVGPKPVQHGGPRLLVGTIGPKTVRSAAAWADGLAGTTLDLHVGRQNELFDVARQSWGQAGKPAPHLATSFWFAFGSAEAARDQVRAHLRRYMNWIPVEFVDAMAPSTGWSGSEDELAATLRAFEAVGTDEIYLIPTSSDIDQLRRAAEVAQDIQ